MNQFCIMMPVGGMSYQTDVNNEKKAVIANFEYPSVKLGNLNILRKN